MEWYWITPIIMVSIVVGIVLLLWWLTNKWYK